MTTMLLVITADDLGIDPRRDDGILEAFASGAITQASLMVSGASAARAATRAREVGLPVGLHLDLTETTPSAPKHAIATLLDSRGEKRGKHGLRDALARGEVQPEHVAIEARAQIAAFERLMHGPPSHVDGHQHAHTVPALAEVLAPVFADSKVATTRIPSQRSVSVDDPAAANFYRRVSDDGSDSRKIYERYGVRSTAGFIGLDLMGMASDPRRLEQAVRDHLRLSSLELMCHPGYVGTGIDDFNQSPAREHELRVLVAHPFEALISQGRVKLASFADIARTEVAL